MQFTSVKLNSFNFKGYDACPLKSVYMQGIDEEGQKNIYQELKAMGKRDGFGVYYYDGIGKVSSDDDPKCVKFATRWAQDDKTFINQNGKKVLATESQYRTPYYTFARALKTPLVLDDNHATGGNCFIGKKPDGEKWMLVGIDEDKKKGYSLSDLSSLYDIKPQNIHFISQPDFHLDMAIRPIGYPYILVNDDKLAMKNAKNDELLQIEIATRHDDFRRKTRTNPAYSTTEETCRELKKIGFIPIKVGGAYSSGINYMNAIVNKHPDGTITYITNSAKGSGFDYLDKVFEKELRAKVPNIRDVYFISGNKDPESIYPSPIIEHLHRLSGGIHCLTLEEPDFERWA